MFGYVKTENGFSLVEVMIALCVLLLVFMGLMQSALLGIDANMRSILRDEALRIAAERMEEAKNLPFAGVVDDVPVAGEDVTFTGPCAGPPIADPYYPVRVDRDFRNIVGFDYGTRRTVFNYDADTMRITITVRWEYRDTCFSHRIVSLRRR
jgi:prepilin-type N-terminal cleavage/methylation domain-containing protein